MTVITPGEMFTLVPQSVNVAEQGAERLLWVPRQSNVIEGMPCWA